MTQNKPLSKHNWELIKICLNDSDILAIRQAIQGLLDEIQTEIRKERNVKERKDRIHINRIIYARSEDQILIKKWLGVVMND